jgi:glutamate/tyrosine decarboxylase-like PLP-dependent enzyme
MMTKKSDFIAYTCASRLIDQSQAQQEFTEGALKKYRIPEQKRDPQLVYRTIRDELELNSKPSLNLATFVTTWMDDEAIQLAVESIDVNLIDRSMYPMSTEIHKRIVAMEADMLHADYDPEAEGPNFIGTGTVGSSEAVMLAILAHKTKWMEWYDRLPKEKRPADGRIPNLVIGGAYQVCWEKVYKFFDIAGLDKYKNDSEEKCQCKIPSEETDPDCNGFWGGILWGIKKSDFFPKIGFLRTIWDPQNIKKRPIFKPSPKSVTVRTDPRQRCRIIPLEEGRRVVTKEVIEKCIADGTIDDNTIAIGLVLGTTLTGEVDEIWEINEVLKDFNDEREAKAKENGLPCCYRIPQNPPE